jgi:hypothetical protein
VEFNRDRAKFGLRQASGKVPLWFPWCFFGELDNILHDRMCKLVRVSWLFESVIFIFHPCILAGILAGWKNSGFKIAQRRI